MSTVKVEYIGQKDQKPDNVAGTGLIWHGAGDVHDVPVEAALKLAKHPGVWKILEGTVKSSTPKTLADTPVDATGGLLGTDKLPSLVDIADGQQAQLGDIVRGAFAGSDMTEDEWNGLEPDVRDELILDHLEQLRKDFNPGDPNPGQAKPAAKKAAAKKTAPAKKAAAK